MAKLSSGTLGIPGAAGIDKVPCPSSSMIQSAEYDASTLSATFVFKTGAIHRYNFIYPMAWQQFKDAPSKGKAYNQLFKGKNQSTKILNTNIGRKQSGKNS